MHGEVAGRPEQQDVIVVGGQERLDRDDAVAAGLVLDHHRLAPFLRELLGEQPRADVGAGAGAERHDEFHRPGRPVLRLRAARRGMRRTAAMAAASDFTSGMVFPGLGSFARTLAAFAAADQRWRARRIACHAGCSGSRDLRDNRTHPTPASAHHGCENRRRPDPRVRRAGHRVSPPRRQAAAGEGLQAARRGAVPGAGRSAWRRLVHGRPQHRQGSPRVPGWPRRGRGLARLAHREGGRLSEGAAGHQLRGPLGQSCTPRS